MSAKKVLGSDKPVTTGLSKSFADKRTATVTVDGPMEAIEKAKPESYCPSGYEVDTYDVASAENGMGRLTVRCLKYDAASGSSPLRTTFRIEMREVQYDLEDHPYVKGDRDVILKWLATDEAKRVDEDTYYYADADGELQEITDAIPKKFCAAYMAGIRTFLRFYPVIEKISYYANPPGMSRSGKSFTGGSPTFSSGIGKYNSPPLTLGGYGASNWFKSKDSWQENADKTWTRSEEWTYTPESSSGDNAWIYNNL